MNRTFTRQTSRARSGTPRTLEAWPQQRHPFFSSAAADLLATPSRSVPSVDLHLWLKSLPVAMAGLALPDREQILLGKVSEFHRRDAEATLMQA